MQLSIIIVNYNVQYFVAQALLAVQQACKHLQAEVFVVDNASTDGSKDYLESIFKHVHFIWLAENIGFGKANNLALAQCTGKYVLFLNPDTIVPNNALVECIQFLENTPKAGAVGVRMIDGGGHFLPESKRNIPTAKNAFSKLFLSDTKSSYYAQVPENITSPVDILSGAFLMASRTHLQQIGGFDPAYFMYGEDIDLCYSLKKLGLQNYYLGNITIIHFKGESETRNSKKYADNFFGAMRIFVNKHFSEQVLANKILLSGIHLSKFKHNILSKNLPSKNNINLDSLHIIVAEGEIKNKLKLQYPQASFSYTYNNDIKAQHLLLCEGGLLTIDDIIQITNTHQSTNFLYLLQGSSVIISSGNKFTHGMYMPL